MNYCNCPDCRTDNCPNAIEDERLTAEFKHKLNQANETISDLEASRALANEGAAKLVQNRDEWRKCAEGLASVARPDYVNEQDFDPEVAYDDVRKALADFERLKGQP